MEKLKKKNEKIVEGRQSTVCEDHDEMMKMHVSQDEDSFSEVETDSDDEDSDENVKYNRSKEIDLTFDQKSFKLWYEMESFLLLPENDSFLEKLEQRRQSVGKSRMPQINKGGAQVAISNEAW